MRTLSFLLWACVAHAAVLEVGPGRTYATPCKAVTAASPGDVIEVSATGTYDGDVCTWYKSGITLRGVRGRPVIKAAGKHVQGKAIWVIAGNDIVIENVEMSGTVVPDGNGAAIRFENANLTLRNCYFHHHQTGVMTGNAHDGRILIENSEFAYNGTGTGYTHNLYIGTTAHFTLRYSYSHHCNGGQLVKSRARENHILYNRLTGEDGNSNYELDLANGGKSFVIGNILQQGVYTSNSGMLVYQFEGPHAKAPSDHLYVVNNTFVSLAAFAYFVMPGPSVTTPAIVKNNIFRGYGVECGQPNCETAANLRTTSPGFVDQSDYNYRLTPDSAAIGKGVAPGLGDGIALTPQFEYVHPVCSRKRPAGGKLDIGAFQFSTTLPVSSCPGF